ncbi:MAG: MBL fold metallo-hydrolase [Bacilli bacterium]
MNVFKFYNVGQGLFYFGELDNNFRFVYDCGGSKRYVNNAIKNGFTKGKSLDLLVISHLHEDHTNGIDELIKFTGKPKKIILPYLYLSGNHNRRTLFLSTYFLVNGYSLNDYHKYSDRFTNEGWPNSDVKENSDNIKSGLFEYRKKVIRDGDWTFVLYNKSYNKNKIEELIDDLEKEIGINSQKKADSIDLTISKYLNVKGNIKKIKKIYERYFTDLNISNTILFHFPTDSYCDGLSLLTGDGTLDIQDIDYIKKTKLSRELEYYPYHYRCPTIGYFQVPHHGSKTALETIDFFSRSNNFYISFGLGNKYKHPSSEVIDYLNKHCTGNIHFCYQSNIICFNENTYYIYD